MLPLTHRGWSQLRTVAGQREDTLRQTYQPWTSGLPRCLLLEQHWLPPEKFHVCEAQHNWIAWPQQACRTVLVATSESNIHGMLNLNAKFRFIEVGLCKYSLQYGYSPLSLCKSSLLVIQQWPRQSPLQVGGGIQDRMDFKLALACFADGSWCIIMESRSLRWQALTS